MSVDDLQITQSAVASRCCATSQPQRIIVFSRYPEPGVTKTRLIPALGPENAAKLQAALTHHSLSVARDYCAANACDLEVRFAGGNASLMESEFGCGKHYRSQHGRDLGERLRDAVATAIGEGATRVLVIGCDCPGIDQRTLEKAFNSLENSDVVLGPAIDGGYYLIGLRTNCPEVFREIDWGTEKVLEQTIRNCRKLKYTIRQLAPLSDIDFAADLLLLRRKDAEVSIPITTCPGRLSVIIPTLNEEMNLQVTLDSIGVPRDDLEVIVVDAGSTDQTVEIAQHHGCKVFVGNPGRANQMNAGAAIATGEHLLFLHADTQLPADYRVEIERVLATPVTCGAFPLEIDAQGLALRMVESGVAFRSRILQMPYGDQGLFFRSADFYAQNGFKQMSIMEDYELVARMRKTGSIGFASKPVKTSSRRWSKKGILRTTIINQLCVIAYQLGFSDKTIVGIYRGLRI